MCITIVVYSDKKRVICTTKELTPGFFMGVQFSLGISKRGDTYLRTLLIHGGRTVVRVADKHDDRRNNWIKELDQRRGKNISAVAVTTELHGLC